VRVVRPRSWLDMDPGGRCGLDPAQLGSLLERHVNDRPYVARSLMSLAISRVFRSTLGIPTGVGRSFSINHCRLRRESPCCPAEVTGSYAGCSSRSATITAEHHPLDDENFLNRRSIAPYGRDLTVGFSLQKAIEVVGRSREKFRKGCGKPYQRSGVDRSRVEVGTSSRTGDGTGRTRG